LVLSWKSPNVKLYIENNVCSLSNISAFEGTNPFMLTSYGDYSELSQQIDFSLLFDIAHSFISSNVLDHSFKSEFENMFHHSDYLHISENDGYHDQNKALDPEGELFSLLKQYELNGKIISLEIYSDIQGLKNSFKLISNLIYPHSL